MSLKNELRTEFRNKRKTFFSENEKNTYDEKIADMFLNSVLYLNAKALFIYHSLPDEISTTKIINKAFADGKRVSLPVSINEEGLMQFYTVTSLDDLKIGAFNIMEPDTDKCKVDNDYNDAICVVPALSFDKSGYRLGYGKGYYDRFLKKFTSFSVGLCYNDFISESLPAESYDKKVDFLFTEDNILTF